MQWTKEQQSAIDSKDKNLLVAAAAGSGKTAVLVERITQKIISEDLDVDKMLIVTFTDAAAQEMRTRIHRAITKKIREEKNPAIIRRLERQSILLSGAQISTFHSFCLSVLRRHFAKIDLDPKFRTGDEQELNILKQEVIEKLFEETYRHCEENPDDKDFVKFTDEFDGDARGDKNLHELILKLYEFSRSRPYPEEWLNSLAEVCENPETFQLEDKQTWLDFALDFAKDFAKKNISAAKKICSKAQELSDEIFAKYKVRVETKNLEDDLQRLNILENAEDNWDELYQKLREVDFKRSGGGKVPEEAKADKEKVLELRGTYKKTNGGIISKLRDEVVNMTRAEILDEMKKLAPSIRQLVKTTIEFEKNFSAAKRERGIIDFDDMEHLALKIFNTDKGTAAVYRRKFRVIMVDEYQDTNGVQEEIISKIVDEDNFFAVGDVKQSIYKFRNADPEIFLQKYKTYPALDNSERIDLAKNFRSRTQVVDAVNAIFRLLMTEDAMEINYDKNAELNFGANYYPEGENIFDDRAEFLIVDLDKDKKIIAAQTDDEENFADDLSSFEREMQLIAEKINALKAAEKKVWDGEKYRPLEFRDIVILLRSIDGRAAKAVEILRKNKIQAYASDNGGYFLAEEIQTTLNLLKILDNTRQDIPLAAVMLSPIGGFSAEDLAQLRIADRDSDLYTLIKNSPDERYKIFLAKIDAWREMARQVSVPELLSTIYRITGYYDYFAQKDGGKIAQANLRMLIDRAAAYESTAFRGLSRFIQFIKKIRELNNDLSAARTLGESENVVRVMTIHKSKGLEFPVVFVAQLGKQFNLKDLSGTIITHRNLGVGIYRTEEDGAARVPTFARNIIQKKIRHETLAEELRILYVAFTRAKEKLFLVGTVNDEDTLKKFDEAELSPYGLLAAKHPIDWLLTIKDSLSEVMDVEIFKASELKVPEKILDEEKTAEEKILPTSNAPEKVADSNVKNLPAKFSVTEIKRRISEFEEEPPEVSEFAPRTEKYVLTRRPTFMQTKTVSGAEFGTLMHSVMQNLDLRKNLDAAGILAQIDGFVERQMLTPEQAEIVGKKADNIEKFFASDIGQKIISANEIYRELPFSRQIDAGTINAGEVFKRAAGEKIFVQGIIDLLFKDATTGKWILLDYKTDKNNTDEHFRNEYKEQIRLYAQAVEILTHIKVSEKYLYLLGAGRLVKMDS